VPVGCRPGAESAPQRAGVEPAVGDGDPGEPALYGASGVESPAQPARRGAISRTLSQPALGSEADFVAVQQRRAARKCKGGATRSYVLAGLVQCRWCGRRMDSHRANGRAGYRCRHGHNSARARPVNAARNIYVREDLVRLARQLTLDHDRPDRAAKPSTATEIVAWLRAESKVIVCGRGDWTLAPPERTIPRGPKIASALIAMG
jgi:site-specific DNA recombinase